MSSSVHSGSSTLLSLINHKWPFNACTITIPHHKLPTLQYVLKKLFSKWVRREGPTFLDVCGLSSRTLRLVQPNIVNRVYLHLPHMAHAFISNLRQWILAKFKCFHVPPGEWINGYFLFTMMSFICCLLLNALMESQPHPASIPSKTDWYPSSVLLDISGFAP